MGISPVRLGAGTREGVMHMSGTNYNKLMCNGEAASPAGGEADRILGWDPHGSAIPLNRFPVVHHGV